MIPRRPPIAAAAALVALLSASGAAAHARLVSASPAVRASAAAPRKIILTFNERLTPRFSGFAVTRAGAGVPVKVAPGKDRRSLVGAPLKPPAPGVYQVAWRAVAADAHRMQGRYVFTVR